MIDLISVYPDRPYPLVSARGEVIEKIPGPHTDSKPLRVRCFRNRLQVSGSLPKFWTGQNVTPLSPEELEDAFDRIAEVVGPQFYEALVGTVELGTTLAVAHRPQLYTLPWTSFGRFYRSYWHDGQTVTIGNKSREFAGYDKGAEIPDWLPREEFPEGNGLRLELRLRKSSVIQRVVGHPILVKDLLDPEVQAVLKEAWKKFYFAIPKNSQPFNSLRGMTPADLKTACAHLSVHGDGGLTVRSLIREAQQTGQVRKTTACRMRRTLNEILVSASQWETGSLIEELDQAVRSA